MPAKNVSGTEMTSAHGQETTRNVSALLTHTGSASIYPSQKNGGMNARASATYTTIGV